MSALPWDAATELFPGVGGADLRPSPIVTAYLWFDGPVMQAPMAGLLDFPFDYAFDRGVLFGGGPGTGPLALVKSAAKDLAGKSPETIGELARQEDVGDMCLASQDLWRRVRVGRAVRQEADDASLVGLHGGLFYHA